MTSAEQHSKCQAVDALYADLRPRALALTRRFHIPDHEAEDLIQETFLVYWRKMASINDPPAWIFTTLRTFCFLYWRSSRRRLYEAVDSFVFENLKDHAAAAAAEIRDLRSDLRAAIARVPNPCRRLLHARYDRGHTPADTATLCGYKPSGIHKILQRCVSALTLELGVSTDHESSNARTTKVT